LATNILMSASQLSHYL